MHPHGLGPALELIFTPTVGKVSNQLFFLGIDRDYRLPALLKILDLGVDVLKLRIPNPDATSPREFYGCLANYS